MITGFTVRLTISGSRVRLGQTWVYDYDQTFTWSRVPLDGTFESNPFSQQTFYESNSVGDYYNPISPASPNCMLSLAPSVDTNFGTELAHPPLSARGLLDPRAQRIRVWALPPTAFAPVIGSIGGSIDIIGFWPFTFFFPDWVADPGASTPRRNMFARVPFWGGDALAEEAVYEYVPGGGGGTWRSPVTPFVADYTPPLTVYNRQFGSWYTYTSSTVVSRYEFTFTT